MFAGCCEQKKWSLLKNWSRCKSPLSKMNLSPKVVSLTKTKWYTENPTVFFNKVVGALANKIQKIVSIFLLFRTFLKFCLLLGIQDTSIINKTVDFHRQRF